MRPETRQALLLQVEHVGSLDSVVFVVSIEGSGMT